MKNLLLVLALALAFSIVHADERLINGEVTIVPQIINIKTNGSGCTATIIGKHTIITAAHCAKTGSTSTFKINSISYHAKMKRSPLYPGRDHDICIGKTQEVINVIPMKVVNKTDVLKEGSEIELFGYGCINPGGSGWDGKLRKGKATVTGFTGFDAISEHGSALCFGDSGGPAFFGNELITINSKGNIHDTNYTARLDSQESQDFLNSQSPF